MNVTPTIDIYRDLIVPLGERLQAEPAFHDVQILYDTDEISFAEMPAIEYYVESPWEDIARGSGSYSLQTRRMTARVVFSIWVYDAQSRQRLDEALFHLGGLLIDWLRETTDFNPTKGVGLGNSPIVWQVARPETQQGYVGIHTISVEFLVYT